MYEKKCAHSYLKTSIQTSSRGEILIMLYESAIRNIENAIQAIQNNEISKKCQSIIKAHEIINELINTLNFEIGGKLSQDLERIYLFITRQLVQANIGNSIKILSEINKILENLLSAWKEAVKKFKKGNFN